MPPLILRFVPGNFLRPDGYWKLGFEEGFYTSGHVGFYETFNLAMFMADSYMYSYPKIPKLILIVDDDYIELDSDANRVLAKLKYG